ncbi:MAG TPA: D-glycero-beta-D-manno-heptose-1,7-bisphosphate 7-phosphatase [Gammaproteobacteria bacterium]|nr:D-glycero-beta-D-manno-heptose-1,7-bisphosphate 7-phosphatase [Gammaproteobacteria bacterium]
MKTIILDRDGVINEDSDAYIKSVEEWKPIPGALEAIARLCRNDYRIVVATNQSGVARGLFSIDTLNSIHHHMLKEVRNKGGMIEAIFFCPHGPDEDCQCRKPRTGMLREIAVRMKIETSGVPVVGDSMRDLQAAHDSGAIPVLVLTGKGRKTSRQLKKKDSPIPSSDVIQYASLEAFAEALLAGELNNIIQKRLDA